MILFEGGEMMRHIHKLADSLDEMHETGMCDEHVPVEKAGEVLRVLVQGIMRAKAVYTEIECRLLDEALREAEALAATTKATEDSGAA